MLCIRIYLLGLLLCLGSFFALQQSYAEDQASSKTNQVYHLTIDGVIEHGVAAYVRRVLAQAEEEGVAKAIIEINTPGGRLDSAFALKDALLDTKVHIVVFVNHQALSAGALIAIAANDLYLAKGSVIGAATPVYSDSGEKTPEKIVSATRKEFAAAAEVRGRNTMIAQAMVDESIEIKGISDAWKLLTFTAKEAEKHKFSDGTVESFDDLLKELEISKDRIVDHKPAWAEKFVRFITTPEVASLLLTLGMLALILEFKLPGASAAGLIAVLAYGLFFWGHHISGLAGWEEVLLVAGGILLLAMEIFIVPGFGIAGLAGIACLMTGLFLSFFGDLSLVSNEEMIHIATYLCAAIFTAILASVLLIRRFFGEHLQGAGLVHRDVFSRHKDSKRKEEEAFHDIRDTLNVGDQGKAITDLRPSGTVQFDEHKVSAVSEGDFITEGQIVKIVEKDGVRIVVKAV